MCFNAEFDRRVKELGWQELNDGDVKRYTKKISVGKSIVIQNNEQKAVEHTIEVSIEYIEGTVYEDSGEKTLHGYALEDGGIEYFSSMDDLIDHLQKTLK